MICKAQYGSRTIQFRLERRNVKSLAISVHPAGLVEVVAPLKAGAEEIERRVSRKARWVLKQQRQFAVILGLPTGRKSRSGESIRYLGRQYRLRIRQGEQESIKLTRGGLEVVTHSNSRADKAARLIAAWMADRAREKLTERFQRCVKLVDGIGIKGGQCSIRRMPRRWGSCTRRGRVLLNPTLISASVDCIDYVIIHELCHLRCHHHRPEFYKLLSQILPDWKRRKARLEASLA